MASKERLLNAFTATARQRERRPEVMGWRIPSAQQGQLRFVPCLRRGSPARHRPHKLRHQLAWWLVAHLSLARHTACAPAMRKARRKDIPPSRFLTHFCGGEEVGEDGEISLLFYP